MKEMPFIIEPKSILILIPKTRGTGFLRQPVGHHSGNKFEAAVNDIFNVDCCGLDGFLDIDTGYTYGKDYSEHIISFANRFGFVAKEWTRDDFFDQILR